VLRNTFYFYTIGVHEIVHLVRKNKTLRTHHTLHPYPWSLEHNMNVKWTYTRTLLNYCAFASLYWHVVYFIVAHSRLCESVKFVWLKSFRTVNLPPRSITVSVQYTVQNSLVWVRSSTLSV
jgi:hypothetical protein